MAIITLAEAKIHLRMEDETHNDPRIMQKLEQASAIVVDYLKRPEDSWGIEPDDEQAPFPIKAATLLVMGILFTDEQADPISPAVRSLLVRYRDPALA